MITVEVTYKDAFFSQCTLADLLLLGIMFVCFPCCLTLLLDFLCLASFMITPACGLHCIGEAWPISA